MQDSLNRVANLLSCQAIDWLASHLGISRGQLTYRFLLGATSSTLLELQERDE